MPVVANDVLARGKSALMPEVLPAAAGASAMRAGRQRRVEPVTNRVRREGKFFRLGLEKFYVKGVTYGPFEEDRLGQPLPSRDQVEADFKQIIEMGANCIRVYHIPPKWFLDLAVLAGLRVFLDVAWPKNISFEGNREVVDVARKAVREAARQCGNHPAIFAISVVNEFPPDLVRFIGKDKVEDLIDELVCIVKEEAPDCLATFANFPTTEYLRPRQIDFVCFNVYLHNDQVFRNYLARLQNIAGDRPLMLGEYGIDTHQEYTEEKQAEILTAHVKSVFEEGLAGTFIFSFTDDWVTHGYRIEEWKFGVTRRDRSAKPAYEAVRQVFRRVPQTFDDVLPSVSVIICSYNGASTVESCLHSMQQLRYPGDVEIIFVDDGSTDNTQEILKRFPGVRNIRQHNKGLSFARNVGMEAARGEVIVYTDSDCEADEDWLYYLAVSLKRSGTVGMGGPNLIPDEGSWVADCVGLSPGGPTHVMIDDRTAEHVPGCNMAFYTAAAKQINGFDSQYRKAGDDVDFIWRLQNVGYSMGFSPAAQVWHYRRNTVQAYLKQQRGYGEAEALLKYKHPDRFNSLGASHWRGRIYGGDQIGVRIGGDVIYHGMFGTGLFQTIYRQPASMVAMMMMSIEWHLLAAFVTILGLAILPLLWVAMFMFLTPVVLAMIAAIQAPMPEHEHWLTRPLIAYLHFRQPIARGWARYAVRLKHKVMNTEARGYDRPHDLPFDPQDRDTLRYWSSEFDRVYLLQKITEEAKSAGWRIRLDSGWSGWDMEIYGSRYSKVRVTTASEQHEGRGKLTRVRVETFMSKFCLCLFVASLIFCGLLLLHVWPFSRPAVLIPLAWWAMFLVNRRKVTIPVLGMIDEVAHRCAFLGLPAEDKPKSVEPAAVGEKATAAANEFEEHEPSVV